MENEAIKEKVEDIPKKTVRDSLYGNLDISVKTMDRVLIILFILLALSLIVGILI